MNCGQTASIPKCGQDESQHHDLPIQNHLIKGDGSTASQRQVNILMAGDKLLLLVTLKYCDWCEMQIYRLPVSFPVLLNPRESQANSEAESC